MKQNKFGLNLSKFTIVALMTCITSMFSCINEIEEGDGIVESTEIASLSIPSGGYSMVWEDQFNGTSIDTNNWTVGSLKDPSTGHIVPGAHGDHLLNTGYAGYITAEDCYLLNGALVLRNQKRTFQGNSPSGTYQYTSGWVMSMHKVFFNKGYVEMRAKFPAGEKVWPALWLIAEDLTWGPEWDMFEYFGYRSDVGYDNMGLHLARGSYPNITWHSSWISNYNQNYVNADWHVYGFEWTGSEANWYIDGQLVHTLTRTSQMGNEWPNEDMYIVLNNGVKSDSPEGNTVFPNYLEIDYIQVYQQSPETVHVESISTGTQGVGQGYKAGTASVTIHDNLGNVVQNATVSGTFSGDINESVMGQTDANGNVSFLTNGSARGNVSFNFCVNDVTHASLTYDDTQNVMGCN